LKFEKDIFKKQAKNQKIKKNSNKMFFLLEIVSPQKLSVTISW